MTESVCESEYIGIYDVSEFVEFVTNLLDFLEIKYETPIIHCDNRSTVYIANSWTSIDRTKLIKAKHFKVQIADILANPLSREVFEEQRKRLVLGGGAAVDVKLY